MNAWLAESYFPPRRTSQRILWGFDHPRAIIMTRLKLSTAICGALLFVSTTCAPLARQDPTEPNINVNIERHGGVAEEDGTKFNPVEIHHK